MAAAVGGMPHMQGMLPQARSGRAAGSTRTMDVNRAASCSAAPPRRRSATRPMLEKAPECCLLPGAVAASAACRLPVRRISRPMWLRRSSLSPWAWLLPLRCMLRCREGAREGCCECGGEAACEPACDAPRRGVCGEGTGRPARGSEPEQSHINIRQQPAHAPPGCISMCPCRPRTMDCTAKGLTTPVAPAGGDDVVCIASSAKGEGEATPDPAVDSGMEAGREPDPPKATERIVAPRAICGATTAPLEGGRGGRSVEAFLPDPSPCMVDDGEKAGRPEAANGDAADAGAAAVAAGAKGEAAEAAWKGLPDAAAVKGEAADAAGANGLAAVADAARAKGDGADAAGAKGDAAVNGEASWAAGAPAAFSGKG